MVHPARAWQLHACPLVLALYISSIWLLLSYILYNKIVIGVEHFLEFCVLS